MRTTGTENQMTGALPGAEFINQWLGAFADSVTRSRERFTSPTDAWLPYIQSIQRGSLDLRRMQFDAVQNAQIQTSQLARSLAKATSPLDVVKAWQQYSQEFFTNTMSGWTAYRNLVHNVDSTETRLANSTSGKGAQEAIPIKRRPGAGSGRKPIKARRRRPVTAMR